MEKMVGEGCCSSGLLLFTESFKRTLLLVAWWVEWREEGKTKDGEQRCRMVVLGGGGGGGLEGL
jgi:hypothetical protein